ncbi:PAS domain-containing hybrid sensor histidine kinase/response regulator [Varunaivibrio sulfuroxidans]|uniref:histidine kinase n=1 Tax=Varunaivibrio sulfuroxidans TaxID=1773489 RepID=A0A4R3JED3_9PROT|nr:PAS domain-containing sensor histidine kinase [Varunaivibrio sulfuroxidans]TCS63040.1 two-component system cell cycle sensor histidine kinase/response regulator CckA [Varunaivibrio sulfuroxidans]WES31885.1 PAS domain S-box protein [Varunaivibrio sulfuroxidans]
MPEQPTFPAPPIADQQGDGVRDADPRRSGVVGDGAGDGAGIGDGPATDSQTVPRTASDDLPEGLRGASEEKRPPRSVPPILTPRRRAGFFRAPAPYLLIFVLAAVAAGGFGFFVPAGGPLGDPVRWLAGAALLGLAGLFGVAYGLYNQRREGDLSGLFLEAVSSSPEGVMLARIGGATTFANPAFVDLCRRLGGATSMATIQDALDGGDAVIEEFSHFMRAAYDGVPGHVEVPLKGADGERLWYHIDARVFAERRDHVAWSVRDVTARRELEEVRRREGELLADLLDNLPVGFFSVDGAGKMIFANMVLAQWLGQSFEEMRRQGRSFSDYVIASGGYDADEEGAETESGGDVAHGEVTLLSKMGDNFKAFLLQNARADDAGDMLYSRSVVLRDVTWTGAGDNRDDRDVRRAAQKVRWLFDEAPVGIVLIDLSGNVTEANRAFLNLIGKHRDDVCGRAFSERLAMEDRNDVAGQLSKVVMGISRAAHLEVHMPASANREVVASLYASKMEDAAGDVSGLVLHFIDTTEQKHLEVQFTQSQKMQAIGQLAGGVAHDFNNLLTAMIGFSDLLLTRHGPDDPSFADVMQIRNNALRATGLVRHLLAFSRKQTLKPQMIDLSEVLAELSNTLLDRLLGPTIDLQFEHSRDLWPVRADKGQFEQVIINLAVNARDAMPGGGTLTVRTANRSLGEAIQRGHEVVPPGEYVVVDVMDTGVGIAKENMERIFEPFFTTKDVGEGTGLGLSTVYGIVHQTGGFLLLDSAPGEGTVFSIYLPRARDDAPALDRYRAGTTSGTGGQGARDGDDEKAGAAGESLPSTPVEPDLTGSATVLLVEDEDAVRMFAAQALRNKGYHVIDTENGEAALDAINVAERPLDLIISDVVMPGMDGPTLVQLVRQELPDIKVILISGYAEDVTPGGITAQGDIHFLAKPFTLKALAGKVKDVLDGA